MDGVIAKIGPFFNWCIREKYSRENPVKGVISPKEDESEPCILTPDEVTIKPAKTLGEILIQLTLSYASPIFFLESIKDGLGKHYS